MTSNHDEDTGHTRTDYAHADAEWSDIGRDERFPPGWWAGAAMLLGGALLFWVGLFLLSAVLRLIAAIF